jgi:hypothetical protein
MQRLRFMTDCIIDPYAVAKFIGTYYEKIDGKWRLKRGPLEGTSSLFAEHTRLEDHYHSLFGVRPETVGFGIQQSPSDADLSKLGLTRRQWGGCSTGE